MVRLFVGTFLSPQAQELLAKLRDQNEKLVEKWHRKVRFVKASKLHLTWFFLGQVNEERIPQVNEKLKKLMDEWKEGPLDVAYSRPEVWPKPNRPRLIVLTPETVSNAMLTLAEEIAQEMKPFADEDSEKPHNKEFHPHITIMRTDEHALPGQPGFKVDLADVEGLRRVLPVRQKIEKIALIKSHLGTTDEYEPLAEFSL